MHPKRILLYNPRAVFYTMPLALMAVGSALDSRRYAVTLLDGRLLENPVASVLAAAEGAHCLGITVLTGRPLGDALAVTRAVRARYPHLPIIWGGWHPSLFPTAPLAEEPAIDITVQGQGEVTFREIVERLPDRSALADVPGIAWRDGGTIRQNAPRPLTDMNALPPVRYDLIDVEAYFRLKGRRQLDYISSTGCLFRCAFCADPFVFNRKWSAIAPERMVAELADHQARFRFEDVDFQDETFFTYRKRVLAVAEEFRERSLNFTWAGTMRADQGERLSEEDFAGLAGAGLRRVLIGVESGSQEMMDWMQKDIRLEQVLECAERCRRHGIGAIFPFIVGFPGESEASVAASMNLVKRLRAMSPRFDTPIFYFKPYPGSRITREVQSTGYRLPETLAEWADFDYIGSSGPWVAPETFRTIERFKFFSRIAWGKGSVLTRPVRALARWRCGLDRYDFPVEKIVSEWLRPGERLS